MKTLKLKKIITLTSLLILLFSSPLYSQGLPGDDPELPGDDPEFTGNVDDQVPIDQDVWLGLIGGCLISAYFISRKQKKSLQ